VVQQFDAGIRPLAGIAPDRSHRQAIQWIGQQMQSQAPFLADMDAFWVLMPISLAPLPLALACARSS
jgi:hypothetical protein